MNRDDDKQQPAPQKPAPQTPVGWKFKDWASI